MWLRRLGRIISIALIRVVSMQDYATYAGLCSKNEIIVHLLNCQTNPHPSLPLPSLLVTLEEPHDCPDTLAPKSMRRIANPARVLRCTHLRPELSLPVQ